MSFNIQENFKFIILNSFILKRYLMQKENHSKYIFLFIQNA